MEPEFHIGELCEYISDHKTIIWNDGDNSENKKEIIHQIEKGDLFVLLKIKKTISFDSNDKANLFICRILLVKSGIVGGIVCYDFEIQIKK